MQPQRTKQSFGESFRLFVGEWTGTILILLFGMTTLLQAFVVPTTSMESTILVGDHLFVDKLAYSPSGPLSRKLLPYLDVKRGDIIVFRTPIHIEENYVKRVIGVPGDHIRIANRQLILNGKAVDEPYKRHSNGATDPYLDNFPAVPINQRVYPGAIDMLQNHVRNGELIVPAGRYFALGDNRDVSMDSRFWGFVPRENITGKPLFIYWSFDATTERLSSGNIDPAHLLDIATNFFSKTRWNRMMRPLRPYPLQ